MVDLVIIVDEKHLGDGSNNVADLNTFKIMCQQLCACITKDKRSSYSYLLHFKAK